MNRPPAIDMLAVSSFVQPFARNTFRSVLELENPYSNSFIYNILRPVLPRRNGSIRARSFMGWSLPVVLLMVYRGRFLFDCSCSLLWSGRPCLVREV